MITLDDIVGMTDLTEEEIAAIGLHEHMEMAPAAAMADYLMHRHKGPQVVQRMICEDIREALHRGDLDAARGLIAALRHFIASHPEAQRGVE